MAFLTIAVPTYNRAVKLKRVLGNICAQIRTSSSLLDQVEVLVSDNCSADGTQEVLAVFDPHGVQFQHFKQDVNLGLDGNMRFLYCASSAEYVWYFSDDDILFPMAIEKVITALHDERPDALLFSFVQPPGSTGRTFDYQATHTIIDNPEAMVKALTRCPKLSIYVLKRIDLSERELSILHDFMGTDYDFIAVAFTILQRATSARVCIISEPLAGCDPDFNRTRFSPGTWGRLWVVYRHPYVKAQAPHLEESERRLAYYQQLQFLFAVKTGALSVEDPVEYDAFISRIKIHPVWLFQQPRSMAQMILLRLGLARFWPLLRSRIRAVNHQR